MAFQNANWQRSTALSDISAATLEAMIGEAREASTRAYSPYSGFRVGAAVLSDGGDVFAGCNVENASYGLAICAERNAVFHMIAKGGQRIELVVVYTPTREPAAPCGACRQVISEFGPAARLISVCDGPERIDTTMDNLLPAAFGPHNLENL